MFDLEKVHADALAVSKIWRRCLKLKILLQISGLLVLLAMSSSSGNDLNGLRFAARLMVASSKSEQLIKPAICTPWGTALLERHLSNPCLPPRVLL